MKERASGMEGNWEVEEDNEQEEEKWRIWDKRGNLLWPTGGKIEKKRSGLYHESLVGLVQLGEVWASKCPPPSLNFLRLLLASTPVFATWAGFVNYYILNFLKRITPFLVAQSYYINSHYKFGANCFSNMI